MNALIALLRKLDRDLLRDHATDRYLSTKIGEVVVGVVWTQYMIRNQPADVAMWWAYVATMLGWSAIKYGIKKKAGGPDAQAD